MKKALIILISLSLFCSCTVDKPNVESDMGIVKLDINSKSGVTAFTTKSTQAGDDFSVVLSDIKGAVVKKGSYAEFKELVSLKMTVGDYTVMAEDKTEEQAKTEREGKGVPRYADKKIFTVAPEPIITQVSLLCIMANSRVSVGCNNDFNLHFKAAKVKIYEQSEPLRFFEFDKDNDETDEANWVYFNVDNDPEVNVEVSATRHNGSVSTYSKQIKIDAKGWYKLNLAPKPISGTVSIDIKVDKLILEEDIEFDINPYEN